MPNRNRGYKVKHTDATLLDIDIPKRIFIDDLVDITLIGKRTLEYGQELNENVLHLLEHFACPSLGSDELLPDPDEKLENVLNNPILGQMWYNTTERCLCVWTGMRWEKFTRYGDISGNSGFMFDGEYIPIPYNKHGVKTSIENCSINISPMFFNAAPLEYSCFIESDGKLNCKYSNSISGGEVSTYASYVILCDSSSDLPPDITPTITPTLPPLIPLVWNIAYTSNGGSIQGGNTFYSTSIDNSPSTRTNKYIGEKSYFNCRVAFSGAGMAYVGICDETLDTRDQSIRPGLTQSGLEVTSDGRIIHAATSIHNFTPHPNMEVDFAVSGNMIWVRVRQAGSSAGADPGESWIGGGDPSTLTNPTAHISGSRMYVFASIHENNSTLITLNNTEGSTTGVVPSGYTKINFL